MTLRDTVLEMKEIRKSFAGVPALHGVQFSVNGGQIHALLGANGAGKSTLMKILTGAYQMDTGSIVLNGQPLNLSSPSDAQRQGIHCMYQEVDSGLVPQLTVLENIMLNTLSDPDQRMWLQPRSLMKKAGEILQRLGIDLDLKRKVSELSIAEKGMVLLARILVQDAKIIIFDEPTAPLSGSEAEAFFRILHELKHQGVACIFITHRLQEVIDHADEVTIMRDGQEVFNGSIDGIEIDDLITHMLGKTFLEEFPKVPSDIGDVILDVNNLQWGRKVRGANLQVRQGQIVAVVGLVGAGKTEFARLLAGAERPQGGEISLRGKKVAFGQPAHAVDAGIVLVPEERRKQGIFIADSVQHNLVLPILGKVSKWGFLSGKMEETSADSAVQSLGIKTSSLKQLVKHLSGGNQQKVAIGKWLEKEADIYLFDEPTKGVDVGAKSDIFRIIGNLAAQGKGIVYFTGEFDEGLGIGDIIAVMYDGEITAVFPRGEVTQEKLLYYASGGRDEYL